MTDLELVNEYIEKCSRFVNPMLLGEVSRRGLYNIINYLPNDRKEAKAVAYSRLAKQGKVFGDPQIDQIAGVIERCEFLRTQLTKSKMTEADENIPILIELLEHQKFIINYFKS